MNIPAYFPLLHEDIHRMTLQNYGIDTTGDEKNA